MKSASGRVLVAFQSEQEARRLLSLATPPLSVAEQKAFAKSIQKVAAEGFAFSKSNQFSGVEAISYPIFDLRGSAIAAITVPYVQRLDDATRPPASVAQSELAKVAAELNAALGGGIVANSVRAGQTGVR